MAPVENPLAAILKPEGVVVIDGGLATHMETLGADIDHALWSARCLQKDPAMIRTAHRDYYAAGADVAITASYQAHFGGFSELGVEKEDALNLMQSSVALAREASKEATSPGSASPKRLVAGSVGPYGASLHNGAEYTGDYPGMDEEKLLAWHRPRIAALLEAGCDLLACETVPCLMEARALMRLLEELRFPAWLSFSCRSGTELCSGEAFEEAVKLAAGNECIVAVGVNCTAPEHISSLVRICSSTKASHQSVIVYPNSGETWDGESHNWKEGTATKDDRFAEMALEWASLGADCIGGCCRTGPSTIRALRRALKRSGDPKKRRLQE
eukprot:CAMPEP_0197631118 /NCGR_PEP_ID=MMETSP1338-20131121/8389_1 /TAXON_ID=43686 ORGANISM="Pelagodinium beii, Strain RCC1491" /NCGR_SAMPLE_ID=MMETSP1338 /ASSEMBLY_ACC=CAM_ASM_000754 /LENGTH=327 /DNA_ID=CAMNT_0043202509 /DNA_START=62 /DNA_END=1045 /DNA_ORIENTATION=+